MISRPRGVCLRYSGPLYKPQRQYERMTIKPIGKLHKKNFWIKTVIFAYLNHGRDKNITPMIVISEKKFNIREIIIALKMQNISCNIELLIFI